MSTCRRRLVVTVAAGLEAGGAIPEASRQSAEVSRCRLLLESVVYYQDNRVHDSIRTAAKLGLV